MKILNGWKTGKDEDGINKELIRSKIMLTSCMNIE